MFTIEMTKSDFRVLNATAPATDRYPLTKIHVVKCGSTLRLESSDTHILVRKDFDIPEDVEDLDSDFVIQVDFMKRVLYMARKNTKLAMTFDMESKTITVHVDGCTIIGNGEAEKFPNTDPIYPTKKNPQCMFLTKRVLEKLLKSVPDQTFIKFSRDLEDQQSVIVVETGNETSRMSPEKHLIMPVIER